MESTSFSQNFGFNFINYFMDYYLLFN